MSDVTPNRMKISREGVVLIKSFEGFRPRAVARPEGGWVIGYGHTASAREGLTVGEADAELLLQYDLLPVVKTLHERVTAPLNQHQFDALASFAFSLGVERFVASDVLARVNAGASAEAADALFGWPEAPGPDAAMRRRAAERALFVAAPGVAVTLADLLAAPLPLPVPGNEPAVEAPDARAAALAHLLGERDAGPAQAEAAPAPSPEPESPPQPVAPAVDPQLQRYSPYQAAVIGSLPPINPQRALAALNLSPIALAPEPAPETAPETVEPANDAAEQTPTAAEEEIIESLIAPAEVEPEADVAPSVEAEPVAEPEPVVEADPSLESPETVSAPEPEPEAAEIAETVTEPEVVFHAEAPSAPAFEEPPIIAPVAPEPLVLTPLTEAEAASDPRPLWSAEQRTFGESAPADAEPLFEDGGETTLGPILRHEVDEAAPRRFDWSETGAFLAMGGIGLVSFGAAMAAFRRAGQEGAGGEQTALIGWVLAVIALICVGVSTFNLYSRLGRAQTE